MAGTRTALGLACGVGGEPRERGVPAVGRWQGHAQHSWWRVAWVGGRKHVACRATRRWQGPVQTRGGVRCGRGAGAT